MLAARLRQFRESGASKAYEGGINAIRAARGTEGYTNGLPSAARALSEGVTRFKSEGVDIAIIKEGGGYRLYDFESGHITRVMSEAELDELVQKIKDKQLANNNLNLIRSNPYKSASLQASLLVKSALDCAHLLENQSDLFGI